MDRAAGRVGLGSGFEIAIRIGIGIAIGIGTGRQTRIDVYSRADVAQGCEPPVEATLFSPALDSLSSPLASHTAKRSLARLPSSAPPVVEEKESGSNPARFRSAQVRAYEDRA